MQNSDLELIRFEQAFILDLANPHVKFIIVEKTEKGLQKYAFGINCLGNSDEIGCIHKLADWFKLKLEELMQKSNNPK